MYKLIVLVALILIAILMGCATPLTEYERTERQAFNEEVWAVCVVNYEHKLTPMSTVRYTGTRIKPGVAQARRNMADDIRTNNCLAIYWAAMEDF